MNQDKANDSVHAATAVVIAQYFKALGTKDLNALPLATDVILDGPMVKDSIKGEADVRAFLAGVISKLVRIGIKRQIIDGHDACILLDFETTTGAVIEICDVFKVIDGKIQEIQPYFDPRPVPR